jgi:predicted AAA+ superfamily ATPase
VARYDLVGKRLFEIGDKFYFENLGIRNAIWGYRIEDRGKIIENVVYNHLVFRGYVVKVGVLGDKEIDFIAEKKNEKIYVQVALTLDAEKTMEREFGNLLAIDDNYPKMVVTLSVFDGASYQGVKVVDLRSFLKTV